ncbi:MAG TPA: threonine ammonia-lyase [Solirubrobacteraceae bacterium]|nr:threonine ammonia-lyase [Solirubrobacteraceae bacterium]
MGADAPDRTAAVTADDVARAARALRGVVRETPVLSSQTLSEMTGITVALKAESLQRTGSFKIRGALAKLASLRDDECRRGVIAGSAGNHAQAVAYAARARGIHCEVVMPAAASMTKAEGATALGAEVHLVGATVDDSLAAAHARAAERGLTFVHPFNDPEVIAGQGSVGLELLDQVPDLERVVVPLGGGGLLSGTAIAIKAARPEVEVIGVQVEGCAPFPASLAAGEPIAVGSALTIADGIAVKRPGTLTLALIERWVDRVLVVGEDATAEAMVYLLERAKLVVEGAGAVGVAALMAGQLTGTGTGTTAVILSGGNVDPGLLGDIARRHESQAGRRAVLLARLPDRPGSLAQLLALIGERGANLVDVEHIREGFDLHVRESAVQLVFETRGAGHAAQVVAAVRAAGYDEPIAVR